MTTPEIRSEREDELAIRIAQGEKLSPVAMLEFFNLRIQTLSSQLPDGGVLVQESLDSIRQQKEAIRLEIVNSGEIGIGEIGESTKRDAHRPHR